MKKNAQNFISRFNEAKPILSSKVGEIGNILAANQIIFEQSAPRDNPTALAYVTDEDKNNDGIPDKIHFVVPNLNNYFNNNFSDENFYNFLKIVGHILLHEKGHIVDMKNAGDQQSGDREHIADSYAERYRPQLDSMIEQMQQQTLDNIAAKLKKLKGFLKRAFVPPVILAVPISVEFGIAMAGALETALGISTIAGLSLTAYLYSLQDKGITHFTIEDLGLENPETEAKLAQLYKEKGNNVTEEDIMNAIVPKRNPNFKLPENSYGDLKERPKTTNREKVNVNNLPNTNISNEEEEKKKRVKPVYIIGRISPNNRWLTCFKNKPDMETYLKNIRENSPSAISDSLDSRMLHVFYINNFDYKERISEIKEWRGCDEDTQLVIFNYVKSASPERIFAGDIQVALFKSNDPDIENIDC